MLGAFLSCLVCARADEAERARSLAGVLAFPGIAHTVTRIGALPKDGMNFPQPDDLSIVGSVFGRFDGGVVEKVVYAAPNGKWPRLASYTEKLRNNGWRSQSATQPYVFENPSLETLCGAPHTGISVERSGHDLIVTVGAPSGTCGTPETPEPVLKAQPQLPVLSAPENSTFLSHSRTTYTLNSFFGSIGLASTSDVDAILAGFAPQMTGMGWRREVDQTNPQSLTFRRVAGDGSLWLSILHLDRIRPGIFLLSVSSFKASTEFSTGGL